MRSIAQSQASRRIDADSDKNHGVPVSDRNDGALTMKLWEILHEGRISRKGPIREQPNHTWVRLLSLRGIQSTWTPRKSDGSSFTAVLLAKRAQHRRLLVGEIVVWCKFEKCARVRALTLHTPCVRLCALDKQAEEERNTRSSVRAAWLTRLKDSLWSLTRRARSVGSRSVIRKCIVVVVWIFHRSIAAKSPPRSQRVDYATSASRFSVWLQCAENGRTNFLIHAKV